MNPNKTQPMGLKDFFKYMGRAFSTPPIAPGAAGPGFTPRTETLPNNGGTYQTPVPNMSMAPAKMSSVYSGAPSSSFIGPQAPAPTPTSTPAPRPTGPATPAPSIFKGEEKVEPTPPPQLDYSKYMNPKTGKPYTPQEYADVVASKYSGGMVPSYAGDAVSREMGVDELGKRGRELNNARNDIAVGESDPYKVASKSGVDFSPAELSAIEKAYSGVFDPALNDVFVKLERVQKIEDSERETERRLKELEKSSELNIKEMAEQSKYDIALKKTRSGDFKPNVGSGGGYGGGGNGEFAATVDLVSNMEGSVYGKKAVANQLRGLIDAKDYAGAYNQIANTVENQLVGESKQRYVNSRTDLGVMQRMEDAIKAYGAAGGDMGLIKGTEEEIKRKLGVDSGKASALATELWREFQVYRNNMTGAAFGAGESRDYAAVNPTLGKSLDLNLSVLEGAKNQLRNRVYETIDTRVPSAKYIRDYAEGAVPGSGKAAGGSGRANVLSKGGQSFDASALTDAEYQQAIADGYAPQ